jgi:hypothetical protein
MCARAGLGAEARLACQLYEPMDCQLTLKVASGERADLGDKGAAQTPMKSRYSARQSPHAQVEGLDHR